MERHDTIEDRAAEFLARRDSGEWTVENQARLDEWLSAATANRVAYLRLEAVWEEARRLKALGPGLPVATVPPPNSWRTPFFAPRPEAGDASSISATPDPRREAALRVGWFLLSAAAVFVLGVALAWYCFAPPGNEYQTPVGELASVPLKDGSNITLNTATAVRVDLTPKERLIDLERGEAFFVVAKDPTRPFVVEAGSKRVVAVGTQFSVRRAGNEVRVVVTEGTVRFESVGERVQVSTSGDKLRAKASSRGTSASASPEFARLSAGSIARATDGDVLVQETSVADAEQALTWRSGYLTFHDTSLAEAVDEFNRYNAHRIVISDPTVAAIRISGTFRPTNYEAFVRLLESGYSIRSRTEGEETTLAMN